MKTSELTGPALDFMVAKAQGIEVKQGSSGVLYCITDDYPNVYSPTQYWAQGGPIIEREHIELKYLGYDNPPYWGALKFSPSKYERKTAVGPTPLIAAMRCFVASRLGDEVDVPKELL